MKELMKKYKNLNLFIKPFLKGLITSKIKIFQNFLIK